MVVVKMNGTRLEITGLPITVRDQSFFSLLLLGTVPLFFYRQDLVRRGEGMQVGFLPRKDQDRLKVGIRYYYQTPDSGDPQEILQERQNQIYIGPFKVEVHLSKNDQEKTVRVVFYCHTEVPPTPAHLLPQNAGKFRFLG